MIKWLKYRSALGVGVLRYILPYKVLFSDAGKAHDMAYGQGVVSRYDADKKFMIIMLMDSTSNRHVLLAIVYYWAVRVFGFIFYKR